MSEPALRRMTVDEFLVWDDGTPTRYELVDGVPVAMAPSDPAHQIVQSTLALEIGSHLRGRSPCHARSEAGILKPGSVRNYFQADLAITCSPHERGQYATPDPLVVVEVLSPSTEQHDRKVKLPVYRAIPSVREIVLISAERCYAEVHRRFDGDRWQVDLMVRPEHELRLDAIGFAAPLSALYANVALPPEPGDDEFIAPPPPLP